jgi:hypothetical protein
MCGFLEWVAGTSHSTVGRIGARLRDSVAGLWGKASMVSTWNLAVVPTM